MPKTNTIEKAAWATVIIGAGCMAGTLISPWFAQKLNVFSQVGDFAGGIVGPIWSLAAVLFFIAALKVQKEQLEAQNKDLELQREELAATREVFEQQKFETTFFNLLENHRSIIKELILYEDRYTTGEVKEYKGKIATSLFFTIFQNQTLTLRSKNYSPARDIELGPYYNDYIKNESKKGHEHIKNKYYANRNEFHNFLISFLKESTFYFDQYLKSALSILICIYEFEISNTPTNEKTAISFSRTFSRMLSQQELLILFYYSSEHDQLKKMSLRYNFFNELHEDMLLHDSHKELLGKNSVLFNTDEYSPF
ncbi:hypothetical protein [Maridesulfovibrio sp.]|uniref:hypothetical protein n=1 Tax=Maridesulfovibrio sp. TaxID=2795000 RepID=UPI002AA8B0F0|nr:hypothetical protein [Maridesulfovibrio sp.]